MPITECERMDYKVGFYGVSKNVRQDILTDIPETLGEIIHIDVIITTDLVTPKKYFCYKNELDELELKKYLLVENKEGLEFYNLVATNLTGICVKCLEEYNNKYQLGYN